MNFKTAIFLAAIWLFIIMACDSGHKSHNIINTQPYLLVLGTAQDGGYPHAGCRKDCCRDFFEGRSSRKYVSSVALVIPQTGERFLFDCTPDFIFQHRMLDSLAPAEQLLHGIFITHAHMGHYTGLLHLGRESMNSKSIPVYALPRMKIFLEQNGPWSQLVQLKNILLRPLTADSSIVISEGIQVTPFLVPHRDEFSETAGYRIHTGSKSVVFIPDIDKWEKWERNIVDLVKQNDLIFIDGTFFSDGEISGRNMSEIPHPFMEESMKLFSPLPDEEKKKIHFIHLNHTNPALQEMSTAWQEVTNKGFRLALQGEKYYL
jgi:pyrroloquinoline quinone biosynthesis protein B